MIHWTPNEAIYVIVVSALTVCMAGPLFLTVAAIVNTALEDLYRKFFRKDQCLKQSKN